MLGVVTPVARMTVDPEHKKVTDTVTILLLHQMELDVLEPRRMRDLVTLMDVVVCIWPLIISLKGN